MGLIVLKEPWTRQPPAPARIDRSNPITHGLVTAMDFSSVRCGINLVGKTPVWDSIVDSAQSLSSGGTGTKTETTGGWYAYDSAWDRESLTNGFTSLLLITPLSTSGSTMIACDTTIGSNSYNWGHYLSTTNKQVNWYCTKHPSTPVNTGYFSAAPLTVGKLNAVAGVADISAQIIKQAINGKISGDTAFTGTVAYSTPRAQAYSLWGTGPIYGCSAVYHAHFIWTRPLTDSELFSVTTSPWQIFAP